MTQRQNLFFWGKVFASFGRFCVTLLRKRLQQFEQTNHRQGCAIFL